MNSNNNSNLQPSGAVASQASRAKGAMFFSLFGGAWFILWAQKFFVAPFVPCLVIGFATLGLLGLVYRAYRFHAPALKAVSETPEKRRQRRSFRMVNVGQWVLLLVITNVLANQGLAQWAIPAAIFIIGAHFIPLARLFSYRPHFLTGAAMMLLAAGYPLLAPAGPGSSVGCVGAKRQI